VQFGIFHGILISFLFGVGLGTIFSSDLFIITWILLVTFAVALLASRKNKKESAARAVIVSCFFVAAFAVGLLRIEIESWSVGVSPLGMHIGEEVSLTGVVVKEPDVRTQTQHLYVAIGDDEILVTADRFLPVSYGDEVHVEGVLAKPESFVTELGREFHYDTYLLAKGVEYSISFAQVEVLSSGNGSWFITKLLSFKQQLIGGIDTALLEPQAGLGKGLLLGVKQALGDGIEDAFRAAGIVHIVVLSGYNIMLIISFTIFVLSFFLGRRLRIVCSMVAVVAFAFLVGLSATVVRASVMALLLLGAQLLGRTYDIMRALLFAAAAMVFVHPYILLYDIGFQFSFMATLGLVLLVPRFEQSLLGVSTSLGIRDYLLSTVATQIAVLPLLLYHIGEVSLVAIIANLLVLPMVPLAMLATFLAGIIAPLSSLFVTPFAFIAHATLSYIVTVAVWCASLPFATITVPAFSAWWVLGMYIVFVYGFFFIKKEKLDEYSDWTIEEEIEVVGKAGEGLRPSPVSTDTPVFFR
jgi:competence protein ComEC